MPNIVCVTNLMDVIRCQLAVVNLTLLSGVLVLVFFSHNASTPWSGSVVLVRVLDVQTFVRPLRRPPQGCAHSRLRETIGFTTFQETTVPSALGSAIYAHMCKCGRKIWCVLQGFRSWASLADP